MTSHQANLLKTCTNEVDCQSIDLCEFLRHILVTPGENQPSKVIDGVREMDQNAAF